MFANLIKKTIYTHFGTLISFVLSLPQRPIVSKYSNCTSAFIKAYTPCAVYKILTLIVSIIFMVLISYLSYDDDFTDTSGVRQLDFQQLWAFIMYSIIELHHDIMFIMFFIISFIIYLLCRAIYLFEYDIKKPSNHVKHYTTLEVVWTITPAVILGWVALPSFSLLCAAEDVIGHEFMVKTAGNQHCWSYENIDPEYMRNALNHSEMYRNYVDIIKRFEVPTGPSYIEDCEYNNVSLRYFLKQLVIRDLREGYKGPDDYLKLAAQVKKIHNITPEQEVVIDQFINVDNIDRIVPQYIYPYATFFDHPNFKFGFITPPTVSQEDYDSFINLMFETNVSGVIKKEVIPTETHTVLIFSGMINEWKDTNTYNPYIYESLNKFFDRMTLDYKKHVDDHSLCFLWGADESNLFTYAKAQRNMFPVNHHLYVRWAKDASEFPIYFIPDGTGVDMDYLPGAKKPTSIYRISNRLNRNSYLEHGFDYDSCLLYDHTLDNYRNRTRVCFINTDSEITTKDVNIVEGPTPEDS